MDRAANKTAHLHNIRSKVITHLCQTEDDMDITIPTLDMQSLQAISQLWHPDSSFDPDSLPSELLEYTINAIRSSATTQKNKRSDSSLAEN